MRTPKWFGARAPSRRPQYVEEMKKITKQRRYAFNNPVRYAAARGCGCGVDRHTAEEALRILRSTTKCSLRPRARRGLKPGAVQIWPEATVARCQDEASHDRAARQYRRGFRNPRKFSRTATPYLRPQRPDGTRVSLAVWEGEKLTMYTPPAVSPTAARHGADLGILGRTCAWSVSTWRHFGNKNQNQDADLIAALLAKQPAPGEVGTFA